MQNEWSDKAEILKDPKEEEIWKDESPSLEKES